MVDKPKRRLNRPALFICDIQEKFRGPIFEYEKVILTTQKLLKAASILSIPIFCTTQNATKLGPTCSELLLPSSTTVIDKTAFSMWIPAISSSSHFTSPSEIVIVGIESHICVTQTALDALAAGHKVYVLADGVSSCNREEVGVALDRLRAEGVRVTTSESWLFECMGDAGIEEFRAVSRVVRETAAATKETLSALLGGKSKI